MKAYCAHEQLSTFLADDILLHWTRKLHKLGTIMRAKKGLTTPLYPLDNTNTNNNE